VLPFGEYEKVSVALDDLMERGSVEEVENG